MKDEEKRTRGEIRLEHGMGWLVRFEHSDTWVDFRAFEVVEDLPGRGPRYYRVRHVSRDPNETTNDPAEAEPSISGYVKWDGCMELDMDSRHLCGAEGVEEYAAVLRELHALCKRLPKVDLLCAGYPEEST